MPTLIEAIKNYYSKPGNECGGNLHIVLEDHNLEDGAIQWCKDKAGDSGDLAGFAICFRMSQLTIEARAQVIYEWIGFWPCICDNLGFPIECQPHCTIWKNNWRVEPT